MLTTACIEQVLERAPALTIGVLGDLFLDRYLDLDGTLTEPSLETGLDAYQVSRVRSYPGAAGTVLNNLVALGVGRVVPIAVIGDDGEGFELRQALAAMPAVDTRRVFAAADRRTPTYTKPMLQSPGLPARELNRLDIKNRTPMPSSQLREASDALREVWPQLHALIVIDHVTEPDCGVVPAAIRNVIEALAHDDPRKFVLADSRERIAAFRGVSIKANGAECIRATKAEDVTAAVQFMAERAGQAVFVTVGPDGIILGQPRQPIRRIPGYPVSGPVDPVGAGDCTDAAVATAIAAGLALDDATAFGCLVASITVQQIGTTGTARPDQVRSRWREIGSDI
jgi:bifunctional ADP-heptose synthase (sugar kinase/adenylyltransferase)